MRINWKLRLQNKTTLTILILGVIALIYQLLSACGITPKLGQNVIVDIALSIIELFCILGIVVDPTTEGISDSSRAMNYTEPNKDKPEDNK